jgi:DNA-binding MarR family transcriptional regulator
MAVSNMNAARRPDQKTRASLPLDRSAGYQVRATHRLVQRALQARIERHGVTLGMWYYLRVLWDQDGLTQRELSRSIGTMEPTTLSAIAAMEKEGLVHRVRNAGDRRKINVFLTVKGKDLEHKLLPLAIDVVQVATKSLSEREQDMLLSMLAAMQRDLQADLKDLDGAVGG